MKLYYPLVAVALIAAGCNKPASNDVATNSDAGKPTTTTTTTTGTPPTGVTTTTGDMPVTPAGSTTTTTTGSPSSAAATGSVPPPTVSSGSGTPLKSNLTVPPAKGAPTAPAATVPPATNGAPPPGETGQQQLTDAQKKQLADMQAKQAAAMKENSAKAAKATKKVIPSVKGKYTLDLDDALARQMASLDAAVKKDPSKKSQADDIRTRIKGGVEQVRKDPPTFAFDSDGNVVAHNPQGPDVKGFTSMIDGKPSIVIQNPTPKAGQPTKLFIPISIEDGGKTVVIGKGPSQARFKRS